MSQVAQKRKGSSVDEKEKRTDSPVKDVKKKMTAQAEKEKPEKPQDSKKADKPAEKKDKPERSDKKQEKPADESKGEKSNKPEQRQEKKPDKPSTAPNSNPTQNGTSGPQNGAPTTQNGATATQNGATATQNGATQNGNGAQNGNAKLNGVAESSSTVKNTRTPETPKPAGQTPDPDKGVDATKTQPKKDDQSTERKLRSTAATPDKNDAKDKKTQEKDLPKKGQDVPPSKPDEAKPKENEVQVEVVIENAPDADNRKPDTNFSKSRVKVSPYRRSGRIADLTNTSIQANYTGNNTTMETDITDVSVASCPDVPEVSSPYTQAIREIKGRRSYRVLKDLTLRTYKREVREDKTAGASQDPPSRPTGTVVGRKRKPETDTEIEAATEAVEDHQSSVKRMRLLERVSQFVNFVPSHTTAANIVGINSDLPLTSPVATAEQIDPETLKSQAPLPTVQTDKRDKRCVVM